MEGLWVRFMLTGPQINQYCNVLQQFILVTGNKNLYEWTTMHTLHPLHPYRHRHSISQGHST